MSLSISHTSDQPPGTSLNCPSQKKATFSLRRVVILTGIAALASLSLCAGAPSALVLASAATTLGIHARNTSIAMPLANQIPNSLIQSSPANSPLLDAYRKATKEKWGENFPKEAAASETVMIKTNEKTMQCLEADTDQNKLTLQPCTGSDRQRFTIENTLRTLDGFCLSQPADTNKFTKEGVFQHYKLSCSIKLIPCPDTPIKLTFINNMIHYQDIVLTHPADGQLCHFRKKNLADYYDRSPMPYWSFFYILQDQDHLFAQCRYSKRLLKYPATCGKDNNPDIWPLERSDVAENRKYCQELINPRIPALVPDIPKFPLIVPEHAVHTEKEITFNGKLIPRSNPYGRISYSTKYIFTGLYTAAGDVFYVTTESKTTSLSCENSLRSLELQVNIHSDHLSIHYDCHVFGEDIKNNFLLRPPSMHIIRPLHTGRNTIRSPYGGIIVLKIPPAPPECQFLTRFNNVFHAPHFKISEATDHWTADVKTAPPWSVLEGNKLTTVIPTQLATSLKNINGTVYFLDEIADQILSLWGYETDSLSLSKSDEPGSQGDILVEDIQLESVSSAAAHAGDNENQAIMVRHDYKLLSLLDLIVSDPSVLNRLTIHGRFLLSIIPHEIGHHLNQVEILTTLHDQVIAELTAVYIVEKLTGQQLTSLDCSYGTAREYLNNGLKYSDFPMTKDDDYRTASIFFRQIMDAFPEKGWRIFTDMAKHYRAMPKEVAESLIKDDNGFRTDYFFELLCNLTHHNLIDHFIFWNVPVSESAKTKVSHMPLPARPINDKLQKNRRLFPKLTKDALDCPGHNTEFSASQMISLSVAAMLAVAYGFYITKRPPDKGIGKDIKIKTV